MKYGLNIHVNTIRVKKKLLHSTHIWPEFHRNLPSFTTLWLFYRKNVDQFFFSYYLSYYFSRPKRPTWIMRRLDLQKYKMSPSIQIQYSIIEVYYCIHPYQIIMIPPKRRLMIMTIALEHHLSYRCGFYRQVLQKLAFTNNRGSIKSSPNPVCLS